MTPPEPEHRTRLPVFVDTDAPPDAPARLLHDFTPALIDVGAHHLCPGCGEPIAMRSMVEQVDELGEVSRAIAVFGIGCYTAYSNNLDIEVLQALHGRAPSLATGVKRCRPDTLVFTVQGDGDMVNEGLQEVLHTAARGENVTCFMLNNGVFGETGGHMTAATVLGQRTKNTLEGRDAARHGHPIRLAELVAALDGAAYVARGAVNNAVNITRTNRMIKDAFRTQREGLGFSFVEILTMCPTGWFVDTVDAPGYLDSALAATHRPGVLKDARKGLEFRTPAPKGSTT
ncbi:thiamine pyrophosphate-dependent enzyme [Yinghuangia seranimata]|uniref:thiamine pyrophosphate-dependent enzyme n=1 Tax=Yinghuangia seranimata TaxID=408067 RepID=UPI00248D3A92|nr:thiamine pyrophosphate-dependent enzyme [Yinghuangia seranimata]MDI2131188.1 thiamine pyrophosphate-dependent enzyme [Yinghuangia seranimata]